jgi:dephospho-CoA kinase
MIVVGLTGNVASGKSSVARMLETRGVPVIDADVLAREVSAPGSPVLARIFVQWGAAVRAADGTLDRAALRRIVFSNRTERAALDALVHPAVKARRDVLLASARKRGERVVVCDIPLLFEAGLVDDVDVVLLVDAPRDVRLARIMRDRGLVRAEALAMIDAQLPTGPKRARAGYVIDNDGSLDALRTKVDETWREIERNHLQASGHLPSGHLP